jgi:hypothetical protein
MDKRAGPGAEISLERAEISLERAEISLTGMEISPYKHLYTSGLARMPG